MCIDWLLRVGDGSNFKHSKKYGIWGISSSIRANKHFLTNVERGDCLWFIKNQSQGQLIAVATYCSHNYREFGPLINISFTNEELGWTDNKISLNQIDIEICFKDLYELEQYNMLTQIKGPCTIRKYDTKCSLNLPNEYKYIVRYCDTNCI
jgi:hypothetical protein